MHIKLVAIECGCGASMSKVFRTLWKCTDPKCGKEFYVVAIAK